MRRTLSLLAVGGALAVVLTACGSDGGGDAGPVPSRPTTTPPTVATTVATTVPPTTTAAPRPTTTAPSTRERLTPSSRLRVDGIGPVRVGMTLAEARAAAGVPLELVRTEFCQSLRPPGAEPFVTLIATSGDRIDVIEARGQTATVAGIRVGSREADVTAAYGAQAQVVNPDEQVHRIVYRPAEASLRQYAIVFTIGDGRVTSMLAGTDAVLADEICA